jgi:hypothetical protein
MRFGRGREVTDHPLFKRVNAVHVFLFIIFESISLLLSHFDRQVRELMDEEMLQDVVIQFR